MKGVYVKFKARRPNFSGILSIMKLSKLSGNDRPRGPFESDEARAFPPPPQHTLSTPHPPGHRRSGWLLGIPARVYTATATLIIRVHFNVNKLLNPRRDTRGSPICSPAVPYVTYSLILDISELKNISPSSRHTHTLHPLPRPCTRSKLLRRLPTGPSCIYAEKYTTLYIPFQ